MIKMIVNNKTQKTLKKVYVKRKNSKNVKYVKMILNKKRWNFKKYARYVANFPMSKWKTMKT